MKDTYLTSSDNSNSYYRELTAKELRNEWQTPDEVFDALSQEFGPFTLDAAANRFNTRCKKFNSFERPDRHPWEGRVWCNPPYSGTPPIARWVQRGYEASLNGARVVLILPAQINAGWFHHWAMRGTILVPKGRVEFVAPPGVAASRARHESLIVSFPQDRKSDKPFGLSARLWSPGDTWG